MSRIFLSHSSANNVEAAALNEWLKREGWEDVFLDIDPDSGIAPGERWEKALNEAASRCEAVLFLISWQWLASAWCLKEFNIAHKLNKRLFGLLLDDIPNDKLPFSLTSTWQFVRLCSGNALRRTGGVGCVLCRCAHPPANRIASRRPRPSILRLAA
jgi:hypothetical protein